MPGALQRLRGEGKELLEIIDEPICLIDSQLKEMEAERIRKRHGDVEKLYAECTGEWAEYLPLKEIYVKKWDNATTSLKQIEKELLAMAEKVASEIGIIRNTQSEVVEDALQVYQKSRDLGAALTRINIYEDNKSGHWRRNASAASRKRSSAGRLRLREHGRKSEKNRRNRQGQRRRAKKAEETLKAAAVATKDPEVPFFLEDEEDDLPFPQPQTVTAFYKVVATEEELERVEMAFNSIGIWFERRDA